MAQRSTAETLAWYERHTTTGALGFNPDGQCLKICRTARNLPGGWPSARAAQDATPAKHRVTNLSKVRPGMVMYFDDPTDGNPYGHIVTVAAVPAGGAKSLADITVWTNSVKSGRVVKVAADYFPRYWGDPFVFAATWLNGEALDLTAEPKKAKRTPNIDAFVKAKTLAKRAAAAGRVAKRGAKAAKKAASEWLDAHAEVKAAKARRRAAAKRLARLNKGA